MEKSPSTYRWRFGYACINMHLAEQGISTNKSMVYKTFLDKGLKECSRLASLNLEALQKVLEWNVENDIQLYRMTSQLFPWATDYNYEDLPNWSELSERLAIAGKYARDHGMRLSFHPGPYNNLGSPDPEVVVNSLNDLEKHAQIMDFMGMPQSPEAKINIHLGGAYGDKESAKKRFVLNFKRCSQALKTRFTLENDDRESLYSVKDLYEIYEQTGVPIVFDGHHWQVGAKSGTYQEDLMKAYRTWGDVVPTLHWSNSRSKYEDPSAKPTAHSDWYYETMSLPHLDCDVMLESKMKEQALLKYRKEVL